MSRKQTYFAESPKQELRSDSRLQTIKENKSSFFNQNQQPSHFKKYLNDDNKKSKGYQVHRHYELQNDQVQVNKNILDAQQQNRLQRVLIMQIQAARDDIWRYQAYLKDTNNYQSTSSQASSRVQSKEIEQLERQIKARDQQIKAISQEIKILKSKPISNKSIDQEQATGGRSIKNPINILTEQIKQARQQLRNAQRQHAEKTYDFQKKREQVKRIESQYFQICLKNDQKPMTFQQFKQRRKENDLRETSQNDYEKSKLDLAKNFGSGKTRINSQFSKIQGSSLSGYGNVLGLQTNIVQKAKKSPTDLQKRNPADLQKRIQQLQNKRIIAEKALKNFERKHQSQIKELQGKLQFLSQQQYQLNAKITQKSKQLQYVFTKFAQGRRKGYAISRSKSPKNVYGLKDKKY